MTNSDEIVEAEFVRLILRGELDRIKEAFEKFASHLISFIHKPIHWVEKHHCLVRLNAIFSVHTENTQCRTTLTYLALAISLIKTMKELVMETQKKCEDALSSFRSAFTLSDGEPLEWTDGTCGIYELIQGLVTKGSFNNGRAKQEDIINFFNATLDMDLSPDASYENGRQMKRRKGRKGMAKYDERRNIESRSYWIDDMRACLNDKWIRQDAAGDGRGVK